MWSISRKLGWNCKIPYYPCDFCHRWTVSKAMFTGKYDTSAVFMLFQFRLASTFLCFKCYCR
jgi:valyl-tRNA synthetase